MKKSESPITSVSNKQSTAVSGIYENVLSNTPRHRVDEALLQSKVIVNEEQALKSSRKFKIALISSYAFLISLFFLIVYVADVLDPRFPF